MYQPTEQELLEMGFQKYSNGVLFKRIGVGVHCKEILFQEGKWYGGNTPSVYNEVYPTSKSDIETLIRLFSNP